MARGETDDIRIGFSVEPIIGLHPGGCGVLYGECLARLRTADGRLLRGGDFIAALETAGLVAQLDTAIARLVLMALSADPAARLGCNISPRTLADGQSWDRFLKVLEEGGASTQRLYLEVTETAPLDDIPDAIPRLMQARTLGCRLAIDDVGSAFATPVRLDRLDLAWDVAKLDRRAVDTDDPSPAGGEAAAIRRLADAITATARLAPVTVVECIETPSQLAAAGKAGAQFIQGRLFDDVVGKSWEAPGPALRTALAQLVRPLRPAEPMRE